MEEFATAKVVFTLPWNSDAITTVAFLGNDTVAAGNKRGDILVWKLPAPGSKAPDPVRKLVGHTNEINRLAVTSDGKTLISCSNDRTLKFWDAVVARDVRSSLSSSGELGKVILNDGYARVGVSEKLAKLPDPPPPITVNVIVQKPVRESSAHKDWIWGLSLARDGKSFVSGDDSGILMVSEVSTGKELRRWKVKQWIRALDIAPDGKTVVTAEHFPQLKAQESDVGVRGYDVQTGKVTFDVSKELKVGMSAIRFSDDGKYLAVCQGNLDREGPAGKVFVLDPSSGKKLRELTPAHQRGASDLAFHPDGKHLVSAGRDRQVKLWRLSDGSLVRELGQPTKDKQLSEPIYAISVSPDGKLLAAADGLGQVVIHALK
ncbi:MAG: hypothetical protein EBV06_15780 [Planctomycetia bacterium]|nr:hypothetical protein [Planctomycetia bacterium]